MRAVPALAAAVLTAEILATVAAASPPSRPARVDFSGTWKLNEALSSDTGALMRKDGLLPDGGIGPGGTPGEGGGRRGGRGVSPTGATDYPFQLLEDERRIAIADDGDTVRITRSRGRKRILFTDGDERELDDGDGPAMVTARRKGASGERIVIASKWSTGRKVDETWELGMAPRRLTVTTKVSARASFTIKRVYDPGPDLPEPEVTPSPQPVAGTVSGAAPVPPQTGPSAASASLPSLPSVPTTTRPAGMTSCSVRPPRGTRQEELSRMAKGSAADAHARAVAFVAPRRPSSGVSSDVESYEGCLVWTFLLRYEGEAGVQEIVVDAGDGRILSAEKDPR